MPCLSIDVPVEVFVFQRGGAPDKPFKWTYNLFWGLTEQAAVEVDMFNQVATNKKIGAMWPNNAPGNAYRMMYGGEGHRMARQELHVHRRRPLQRAERGLHPADQPLQEGGLRDPPGRHDRPGLDHLHQAVRAAGLQAQDHGGHQAHPVPDHHGSDRPACRRSVRRAVVPPDLSRSSRPSRARPASRCATSSRRSRTCSGSRRSCTTRSSNGLSTSSSVRPTSTTKRSSSSDVHETKMADSLAGPIDFTTPVQWGTSHPTQNCVTTPSYGGQWRLSNGGKYQFDLVDRQQCHRTDGHGAGQDETDDLGRIALNRPGQRRPRGRRCHSLSLAGSRSGRFRR